MLAIVPPLTDACECGNAPLPNVVTIQTVGGEVYAGTLCAECLPAAQADHGHLGTAVLYIVPAAERWELVRQT